MTLKRTYDPLAHVKAALADFESRRLGIETDRHLSAEGKEFRLKKLQAEIDAYRQKAFSDLNLELGLLRNDKAKHTEQSKAADIAEGGRWDSARLLYLSQAVQSQIKTAPSFDDAQALYNKATQNADPHVRRAWAEVSPGLIHERFSPGRSVDVGAMERRARSDLEELLATPERIDAANYGREIGNRALEYAEITQTVAAFYGADSWGGNEFGALARNVVVGPQTYAPERVGAEFQRSVEILDAGPAVAGE